MQKNILPQILIVAATSLEVDILKKHLQKEATEQQQISPFKTHFTLQYLKVDVLITTVGMMATAFHVGSTLSQNKPKYDLVVNAGIAGSFSQTIALGTVTQVATQQIADLGVDTADGFLPIKTMEFFDSEQFPYKNGILYNTTPPDHKLFATFKSLPTVDAISVNCVSGLLPKIQEIQKHYKPDIESMEGAGVFYACLLHGVPFVEIRAISNYVTQRNKVAWDIPLAVQNLNQFLIDFLKQKSIF